MTKSSRQKRKKISKKDPKILSKLQFEDLPNEVIFHVFRYLKIVDLLKCGQVSKRFRTISDIWPDKINLCYKKVPVGFLQKLLDNGCQYLSLLEAISEGTLNLPNASRLKYLNLSGFELKSASNRENSEKLLKSCYTLQKLSLSSFYLTVNLINSTCLQNGKFLKVLDLRRCDGLYEYRCFLCPNEKKCTYCQYTAPIQQIVEKCTELKELSLHDTYLNKESIEILVSKLTTKIEKLDLFYMNHLGDKHVKTLVTRCNKITELNVGGSNSITKHSLNFISEHLQSTLVRLNFKSADILYVNDLLELKKLQKLKYFSGEAQRFIGHRSRMKKLMPNLQLYSNSGNTRIVGPSKQEYKHKNGFLEINHLQGFWEIKAEQEELFTA